MKENTEKPIVMLKEEESIGVIQAALEKAVTVDKELCQAILMCLLLLRISWKKRH